MKRIWVVLVLLTAVGVCLSLGAGPRYYRGGQDTGAVYLVVASDAPGWMRRGGPNVYLCNGIDDDVPIQAAIDAAEAIGTNGIYAPTVALSGGVYYLTSPIYIGYSDGVPLSNHGVNLVTLGNVEIRGATINDLGKFTVYFAPKNDSPQPSITGPMEIKADPGGSAGALFVNGLHLGSIRDVRLDYGEVCTFWLEDSWLAVLEQINIAYPNAMGFGCAGSAAVTINGLHIHEGDGDGLGGGSDVGIRKYTIDNRSGLFYAGEEVNLDNAAGAERGVVLSNGSTELIIGHATRTAFTDGQTIYGVDSGATADVNVTIENIGSAMYLSGWGKVTSVNMEDLVYSDDGDGYDFPMVFVDGGSFMLRSFRFEAGNTTAATRRMAKTWFKFDGSYNSGLQHCRAWPNPYGRIADNSVTVTDDGADGTVTLTMSGVVSFLEAGDKVFLWDGAGGIVDKEYTVSAPTGTQFGIDEDPESTETGVMMFALTSAERMQPETLIDADNCTMLSIRDVSHYGFSEVVVDLDSSCLDCVVDNVTNYDVHKHIQISGTQANWLFYGAHAPLLVNAGTNTKVLNIQRWQYAFDYPKPAEKADNDSARQFDGAEIASTTVMDVSSAWGPEYKVYVTGTTQVDELDGGYVGQMVTLIGVHVATGFLIDDDDARNAAGAIDLIGADDDTTLQAYEAMRLICIVDTAAAQIWVEPGNW